MSKVDTPDNPNDIKPRAVSRITHHASRVTHQDDKLHEECGVFGVWSPGEDVARLTYFGLYALQHRGQESAGIATTDGESLMVRTHMGLVATAFDEESLAKLKGHAAIGHTRYSTTGSSKICNAQPLRIDDTGLGWLALGHNGNITNSGPLHAELETQGAQFESTSDSEVIGRLAAASHGSNWVTKYRRAMSRLTGAYSLVLLTPTHLIAVRDPMGIRPLCIGRLPAATRSGEAGVEKGEPIARYPFGVAGSKGGGWVIASESCALMTVGAEFIREVEPGEIVTIGAEGLTSYRDLQSKVDQALCVFEYIYFARPDSVISNKPLYTARQNMGRELAREHPADADIVIGVPDSATPAAIGYALESGIPYTEGLIKNRYIGRTFIQPHQHLRERGIGLKFNPLPEVLGGKRVVVVDDSIVRGTTTRPIVDLLRKAGATEVHVRIHSPAMSHPCYLGVDTARREELIAHRMSVQEIARHIGADSLGYLSLPGLFKAVGMGGDKMCSGCFTGEYPVPVQMEFTVDSKLAIEEAQVESRQMVERNGQLELELDQLEIDHDRVPAGVDK
ncbi:MAG TPA: amidophosphoribosyltransferase [Chloroflexia bacterium]|nr:amidophosphoribosyltransferase [Chloroflexia bacterium]